MRFSLRTSLAAATAAALFLTQSAFLHAAERSFWAERSQGLRRMRASAAEQSQLDDRARGLMAGLAVPGPVAAPWAPEEAARAFAPAPGAPGRDVSAVSDVLGRVSGLATVGAITPPLVSRPDAPVVLLLQDAHGVPSAQLNIARAILRLAEARPNLLVGLEGASGGVDASPFQGPSPKVNRQLGEIFFKAGLIAGPELAAFAAPKGARFAGLEDAALYLRNVRAVRETFPRKAEVSAIVRAWTARVEILKSALWTEALRELDRRRAAREAGKSGLAEHVDYLTSHPSAGGLKDFPQLALFRRVRDMERALDFTAVGRERAALLSRLGERASPAALRDLLEAGVSLRLGRIGQGAYCRVLDGALKRAGVSSASFPGFRAYVDYVAAADEIRPEAFNRELARMENSLARALQEDPVQGELQALVDDLSLLARLAAFRMTPDEWKVYEGRGGAVAALPARLARLEGKPAAADLTWEAHEDFYRAAEARNQALARNLLREVPAGESPVAVLVCGGFHAAGLAEILSRRGAWVATVAPVLEDAELTADRDPLAAFTRTPTPLEALFNSPRPSLVSEPSLTERPRTGAALWSRSALAGASAPLLLLLSRLAMNAGEPSPSTASPAAAAMARTVRVSEDGGSVEVESRSGGAEERRLLWSVSAPGQALPIPAKAAEKKWVVDGSQGAGLDGRETPSAGLWQAEPGVLSRAGSLARRWAPAVAVFLLMTLWTTAPQAAPASVRHLLATPLLVDRVLQLIGVNVPMGRVMLLLMIPFFQLCGLAFIWTKNSFRRLGADKELRASPDGSLAVDAGARPGPEESKWRAALREASLHGPTSAGVGEMMDSAWNLRALHKIPEEGLEKSALSEEAIGAARVELERLARVSLRSAELCAEAMRKIAERGTALADHEMSLFRKLQAGQIEFKAHFKAFSAVERAYGLHEGALHYRNGYGDKPGTPAEFMWFLMRKLQGMQGKIRRNRALLPEAERKAREAANAIDALYASLRPQKTSDPAGLRPRNGWSLRKRGPAGAKAFIMGDKGGNKVRKLSVRYITFFGGIVGALVSYWGHPVLAAIAVSHVLLVFGMFQRGVMRVTEVSDAISRENNEGRLAASDRAARAAAEAVRLKPLDNAQEDVRKAMLAVEGEEAAKALQDELGAREPKVGAWIIVPRDRGQEDFLKANRALFRGDVPVIVLPAREGIESGAAFMAGMAELDRRWTELQAGFPRLRGRQPHEVYTAVFFTGGGGTQGLVEAPQDREGMLGELRGFTSFMHLAVANACRVARSGKRSGGTIFGYLDRASLGPLSAERPGMSLLTAYESLAGVESQSHTVVVSEADGRVRRIFTSLNLSHESFKGYDLENPSSRQFEILAGSGLLDFNQRKYQQVVALLRDLLAYAEKFPEGLRSFHLTSHFIKPLSLMASMENQNDDEVEMRLKRYFVGHDVRAKQLGSVPDGFYMNLSEIFLRHRDAAMPLWAPHASGLSTYYRRLASANDGGAASPTNGVPLSPRSARAARRAEAPKALPSVLEGRVPRTALRMPPWWTFFSGGRKTDRGHRRRGSRAARWAVWALLVFTGAAIGGYVFLALQRPVPASAADQEEAPVPAEAAGGAAFNGNLDPKFEDPVFMKLLEESAPAPAADFLPSAVRPGLVPALDLSQVGERERSFLVENLRLLRESPPAAYPLFMAEYSAERVAALKADVARELVQVHGWARPDVDALFVRLRFGERALVVTARDADAGPDGRVDARRLDAAIRGKAAGALGVPARDLSVNFFTGNPARFTLPDALAGFKLLLIRSATQVVELTLKAYERARQSA
jgi:hypothetical protein